MVRITYKQNIKKRSSEDYKAAVLSAAQWLDSQEYQDEYGICWKQANRNFNVVYTNPESFHTGTSGMIPYLLSVYDVSGDKKYLDKAIAVGERLIRTKDLFFVRNLGFHVSGSPWSIYGGLPGEASAALMLYEKTKIQKFLDFVIEVTEEIVQDKKRGNAGVYWYGVENYGLAGDTGIVLYLLDVARRLKTKKYDDTIREAVAQIISYGEKQEAGGTKWNGVEAVRAWATKGTYRPGIEWGTTGIVYLLADAYGYFGDELYLQQALEGEQHVISVADEVGENAYLVPMNSNNPGLYYIGHCHGAMGIVKMFTRLAQVDGKNPLHKDWIEKLVNGIHSTGAPTIRSPGYWNNFCYCCGTTGLLSMYIGLYLEFGEEKYLDYAKLSSDYLVGNGFNEDGKGLRWYQNWDRINPEDVYTYNGFIIGNAGNAAHLAQIYSLLSGNFHAYRFVEEPFREK